MYGEPEKYENARDHRHMMIREAAQIAAEAQVAELSVQIAEKVVRQNLSTDVSQMQLIDKLLDEVSVTK